MSRSGAKRAGSPRGYFSAGNADPVVKPASARAATNSCSGRAGPAHRRDHSGHQRLLRTDHNQVDLELDRQVGDGMRVERVDVMELGNRGDARVAGCRVHLLDLRVTGERLGQGVLAAAVADHEDLHGGDPIRIDPA